MASDSCFTRDAMKFDAPKIARTATEKALARLGAAPPTTGKYPVVIDADVASELFGLISDYFSAKSVHEKSSLFMSDLGRSIASSRLTVVDDPFFSGGLGTRSFDSEGAPSRLTPLITDGVLSHFLTNSVYAARMDLPHTANAARGARSELDIGISNLIVTPGSKGLADLLSAYPKVIYVTDFTGYHAGFNHGSGDFSLQAEGELWEGGSRVRPLCDFVVAGNIKQLLLDIEDLSSRTLPPTGSVIAPDLLIRELSIAGQ